MEQTYSGIRENKPGRYNDLGGNSAEIAEKFKGGCLKKADRSFAMGLQCQQISALAELMSMEDSVFISHSPQGCTGCASNAADRYRVGQAHRGVKVIRNPHLILTNLDQKSVIFGGEKKLREAVNDAIERYHPKLIFIMASCASGIIGDDIDAIAASMQKETEALIVPIHCEGFKSKICQSGVDATFIGVSKYILPKEKPKKKENLINLLAPHSISYADQQEMVRMLGLLGLEVNLFPFYSSLEAFQKIPEAVASTSICKVFGDEFMMHLEREYGIPYSHTVMPVGMRNTDKWFLGIAKVVGKEKEAQEIIESEHKRILPLVEDIRKRLQGKRVFVSGGTGRSFACAALLEDFGMQLVGIETPTYDEYAQEDIEYLNSIHKDYVVDVAFMQPFEQSNLLKNLNPDVVIGVPHYAVRLGIPATYALDAKRPTMGYSGLLYLGNKIADQLENPGYIKKISKYMKLPYRESWYEENPFKYITGGQGNV